VGRRWWRWHRPRHGSADIAGLLYAWSLPVATCGTNTTPLTLRIWVWICASLKIWDRMDCCICWTSSPRAVLRLAKSWKCHSISMFQAMSKPASNSIESHRGLILRRLRRSLDSGFSVCLTACSRVVHSITSIFRYSP
jgi:hypothetical protein